MSEKKKTTAAVTEYGRAHIWEWMESLSRYAAKQKRTVYAYVDNAVSFASFQPFDPDGVSFSRKSVPCDTPWGFFLGGQGCPETLPKADRANVAEALGNLFPAEVLSAAAEAAAQRKGKQPGKAAEV